MSVLENLEPKDVFHYLEELTKIPRPSYKEEKVSNYLVDFAKKHDFEVYQDSAFNVIMIREAAPGYEDVPPVILQGHMDMVCEQVTGLGKDMDNEGVEVAYDGDYVYAKGTTLGADDGFGVAMGLALMDDPDLKAPRIEFVITTAEEVGMDGATAIDLSMLKGKQFINLDSEDEGIFCLGCAGGSSTVVNYKPSREIHEGVELDLVFDGASGGHSGSTITRWSVNAIRAIARVIASASQKNDIRIISMVGGGKDNAIPKRAEAKIMVASGEADEIKKILLSEAEAIGNEFGTTDPDFKLEVKEQGPVKESVMSPVESKKVATLILALPNGIQRMSAEMVGMPETSLNVGILTLDETNLKLVFAVRSALESGRRDVERVITLITDQIGGEVEINGEYPAWEYRKESPLRDKMVRIFEEMFGKKPTTEIIHAGLECGIMSGKIPGLDCISIGADLHDVHTTEEKLSISSTQRTYAYVKEVLAEK